MPKCSGFFVAFPGFGVTLCGMGVEDQYRWIFIRQIPVKGLGQQCGQVGAIGKTAVDGKVFGAVFREGQDGLGRL